MVVRVVSARPEVVQLTVDSQGEVEAEHTIDLVNEVAGRVRDVAPAFVAGGYFETGDILLELDPTDYDLARIRAEAKVAEAREELEIEKSESQLAAQGLFPVARGQGGFGRGPVAVGQRRTGAGCRRPRSAPGFARPLPAAC